MTTDRMSAATVLIIVLLIGNLGLSAYIAFRPIPVPAARWQTTLMLKGCPSNSSRNSAFPTSPTLTRLPCASPIMAWLVLTWPWLSASGFLRQDSVRTPSSGEGRAGGGRQESAACTGQVIQPRAKFRGPWSNPCRLQSRRVVD